MNCKQGDMAVVIRRSNINPRSVGLIVKVLRRKPNGSYTNHGLGSNEPTWLVEASGPVLVQMGAPGNTTMAKRFLVPDAAMRPLRGDLSEDETTTESPVETVRQIIEREVSRA